MHSIVCCSLPIIHTQPLTSKQKMHSSDLKSGKLLNCGFINALLFDFHDTKNKSHFKIQNYFKQMNFVLPRSACTTCLVGVHAMDASQSMILGSIPSSSNTKDSEGHVQSICLMPSNRNNVQHKMVQIYLIHYNHLGSINRCNYKSAKVVLTFAS